jgi:hypothetical protein
MIRLLLARQNEANQTDNHEIAQRRVKKVEAVPAQGGSTTSLVLQRRNIQRTGTAIGLYMPPAVNVQYNMDYSDGEIGVMGEALYGLFKRLSKRNTRHGTAY